MNYTQAQIDRANAVSLEDFLRTQAMLQFRLDFMKTIHDCATLLF